MEQHEKWGTVLRHQVPNATDAERFHYDLARFQRKNAAPITTFVRFLGADASGLFFEEPGVPWSLAFDRPWPGMGANWSRLQFLRDVTDAMAFLHRHGRVHGGLSPAHCFVDRQYTAGKLYVAPNNTAFSAFTAPEVHVGTNYDVFAADVYSLGCVLRSVRGLHMSYEACDLIECMTNIAPRQRPTMATVVQHPVWWSTDEKLRYLQDIARYDADHSRVAICKRMRLSYPWQSKIPPIALVAMNEHRTYNNTLFALVRWIRNFKEHGRDHAPSTWLALHAATGDARTVDVTDLAFQDACLGAFVEKAFPSLVLDLWRNLA
ncbi:hypothetical protein SPRG_12266 [Saprolegnia parasitica CBS 223.65]|uniref:Uncharacterized protein n=1 Tax=Saprolegnia parasitica (strain CBS 223.65) TaxID=695850 RepID=A0A067C0L0_SAPPC|nr:hypothetical protein SPRG_12266 [Saprolegnia parasitica CBS 223.65]KDO22635.1 hypothetical protein SPRG_12266 [Saprolegnia parasitica CBS 223.65]|eukprot:XP_012206646.1 hypothetical protein SPRG_12266 [Saprolegnia parasitica CBS 223.65]